MQETRGWGDREVKGLCAEIEACVARGKVLEFAGQQLPWEKAGGQEAEREGGGGEGWQRREEEDRGGGQEEGREAGEGCFLLSPFT